MRVGVFGGAGYIGSHVCLFLRDAGHEVFVFDDLSTGFRKNVSSFPFFEGSLLDKSSVQEFFSLYPVDAIIHLAAKKAAGESMVALEKYSEQNLVGSINLLNAAVAAGVSRLVFSSSAAVYGTPQYSPLDENHPLHPENFYGFTKLEIERLLDWYRRLQGLDVVSLRYFNAVGYDSRVPCLERNPQNLFPLLMEAVRDKKSITVFGDDYDTPDGTCLRDYVDVRDLARAHVLALGVPSCTVNLGTGRAVSVREAIDVVSALYGSFEVVVGDRRTGDPAVVFASNSLAKEILGWAPEFVDMKEIIVSMGQAYGLRPQ